MGICLDRTTHDTNSVMWKFVDWENSRLEQKPYGKRRYVRAVCECGNENWYHDSRIKSGRLNNCSSCGHKRGGEKNLKHGHNRKGRTSKTYYIWGDMIGRCTNRNHQNFKYYGGRGIAVCQRWRKFENFLSDMGESNGLSIERVNVDGDYTPQNCIWIQKQLQQKNRRNTSRIEIDGVSDTVSAHCKMKKISRCAVAKRISEGWNQKDAIMSPINVIGYTIKCSPSGAVYKSIKKCAEGEGVSAHRIKWKLKSGLSFTIDGIHMECIPPKVERHL